MWVPGIEEVDQPNQGQGAYDLAGADPPAPHRHRYPAGYESGCALARHFALKGLGEVARVPRHGVAYPTALATLPAETSPAPLQLGPSAGR